MKFSIECVHPSQEDMNAWLVEILQGMQCEKITPEAAKQVRQQLADRIFAATQIIVTQRI